MSEFDELYFTKPQPSQKYHIFGKDGRSLCGRWVMLRIDTNECTKVMGKETLSKKDCKACFKKAGWLK